MIIIDVKETESIDRALKRYKRKHQNIKLMRQLRNRKYFTKPSIKRRAEVMKAEYINQKYRLD